MLIIQNRARPAQIRNALSDLIAMGAEQLLVASAYVSLEGVELLLNQLESHVGKKSFAEMPKTLVTSFDFGITDPKALAYWQALPKATVRVAGLRQLNAGSLLPVRAFHPKLYIFMTQGQRANMLVGSANLTGRGLTENTEAAWAQIGVNAHIAKQSFNSAIVDTDELDDPTLNKYVEIRRKFVRPSALPPETEPVPPPITVNPAELTLFRDAIENGDVDPENFNVMWIQCERLQGGSGNQLELPRGAHRFFHARFNEYDFPDKKTIRTIKLRYGSRLSDNRLLTWHGNNKMERINLPTAAKGGFKYENSLVLFRRLPDDVYELVSSPWDSDLARAWRNASNDGKRLYLLGKNSERVVGLA